MKMMMVLMFFIVSMNANAFEKCVNFLGGNEVTSKIEASETISYKNCPQSILIRDQYVKQLLQIELGEDGKYSCIYGGLGAAYKCW